MRALPRDPVKLAMLFALYFVEGLPWGFQAKALPMYLRTHHGSLTAIGLLNVLSLPWMLKALWAPLVDRYHVARIGRRKSWILPMQVGIALSAAFGAAMVSPGGKLTGVLVAVGLMNLCSATMDIAVDGLAVDVLTADELGTGNTAQVVGYKFGTLASGGLLVWATEDLGWSALFTCIAALTVAVFIATLRFPEPAPRATSTTNATEDADAMAPAATLRQIARLLVASLRTPGVAPFLVVVATYKTGEQLIDSMFKPFLIDSGFTPGQVGLWVSTFGMAASLAGSFVGGLLATRVPLMRALERAAVLRALPLIAVVALTLVRVTPALIVTVALLENFFGGMLTTVMFACMMARTDRRIGATHFTLLSTVEMIGKAPIPILAGPIAQRWGYTTVFALGLALSVVFVLLLWPLRRAERERRAAVAPESSDAPAALG